MPALALRRLRLDARELGEAGEEWAARVLVRSGWTLLGRRVRTPVAEVDLVGSLAGRLTCFEVKAGRLARDPLTGVVLWRPGQRFDAERCLRLAETADWLAGRHAGDGDARGRPTSSSRGRVDLIEVVLEPEGPRAIHHVDLTEPPYPICDDRPFLEDAPAPIDRSGPRDSSGSLRRRSHPPE